MNRLCHNTQAGHYSPFRFLLAQQKGCGSIYVVFRSFTSLLASTTFTT